METGGSRDGKSWADQVEATVEEEEWRSRPAKHCRSASRRRKRQATNPFPLQDLEGRQEAVHQLYEHAGELLQARHDVAAKRLTSQHPGIGLGEAKSLNNQILCMILEYHLTCLSQGFSSLSPVLPEAAKELLPTVDEYLADPSFQGTRDMREVEKAKTLHVAVWLHRLDMASDGDGKASLSLEPSAHGMGTLLELFLAPWASGLTVDEVIQHTLEENWDKTEGSLKNITQLRTWL